MFTAVAAGWSAFSGWASRNPIIMGAIGLFLLVIGWKKIEGDIRAEAKRAERAASEIKAIETVRKIEKEARHDADQAIAARDSAPQPGTPDGVPLDVSTRIFRD